jgi:hypothetical protein
MVDLVSFGAIELKGEFPHGISAFYFPQIADGMVDLLQFQSTMILVNTGEDSQVLIEFFRTGDGQPMSLALGEMEADSVHELELKQGESVSLETPGMGGIQVGYARVSAADGVGGVAVFRRTDLRTGVRLYEAGVPVTITLTEFTIFVDSIENRDTGLAIVYPDDASPGAESNATVTLRLCDKRFQLISERTLDPLAPGSHFARFVHELFKEAVVKNQAREMEGVLVVTSDQPVAALTLRVNDTPGLEFPEEVPILTTFPVIPGSALED